MKGLTMCELCTAVLIDTTSIQKYIFTSNKLRENLGASYLIEHIYDKLFKQIIADLGWNVDFEFWQKPEQANEYRLPDHPIEIGYIGGGNALLFFNTIDVKRNNSKVQEFVQAWTKYLLMYSPGLVPALSIKLEFDRSDSGFKKSLDSLIEELNRNKNRYFPQTIIPRHGITAECSSDGLSLDVWHSFSNDEGNYFSAATSAKLSSVKSAIETRQKQFDPTFSRYTSKEDQNVRYFFPDELDKLGMEEDENNYIAIVHIDGNGIGYKFRETESLAEIRKLSVAVKTSTMKAFERLLENILTNFKAIEAELVSEGSDTNVFKKQNELGKKSVLEKNLPIRPIIIGGDDITFVCPGKFGIYFAKKFLENFENQPIQVNGKNIQHDACAGIAITKTKYPFYRGYELAEALCKNAKNKRKDDGSWLDFQIAYGGFSGSLSEIRDRQYKTVQGDLIMRPYPLKHPTKYKSFDVLVRNTACLLWKNVKEDNFPNNKRKELRKVLTLGQDATKEFIIRMNKKGVDFENFELEEIFKKNLFKFSKGAQGETPYFDMIELSEFYPLFELLKHFKSNGAPDENIL